MIVYEDKSKPKESKKRTCKNCKSELGIEENDIIQIDEYDQREGRYTVKGFICPVCKTEQSMN